MLFRNEVSGRFDASGLHVSFLFWSQRTHFKIAKNRRFCEVMLHEVDGQFHIVFVRVVERTRPGAAVDAQETMSSYLPKSKIGTPAITESEPPVGPIACLRVLRCFAGNHTLLSILRRTCNCGSHENQGKQNQDAFHDRNVASGATRRKSCLMRTETNPIPGPATARALSPTVQLLTYIMISAEGRRALSGSVWRTWVLRRCGSNPGGWET